MTERMYQMIASEKELEWFFNHVIMKPQIYESYSMVWVSRHKKLTKEEQLTFGLTRAESEFLKVETVRGAAKDNAFTFNNFLKHVRRFNVDKDSYTTANNLPLPEKTLAVIFYVNPCNEIKVTEQVCARVHENYSRILTAVTNGHTMSELGDIYRNLGSLDENIKHFRAQCKGSSYWMDFDIDVPKWFRFGNLPYHIEGDTVYYKAMLADLDARFGKGNYVIVSTSGGYHILVRTSSIKSNPHDFCAEVEAIYRQGVADGNPEYLDEKGNCKFEAIINNSQIPGLPLPGTYQYGRPVTILNKEDFN